MHRHRSSERGAAAALTVACTRAVAMPMLWSWSHHPQVCACRVSGCPSLSVGVATASSCLPARTGAGFFIFRRFAGLREFVAGLAPTRLKHSKTVLQAS